jgi:hypothetical protein
MRINRSLLNWGVFLIALGGVPLAVDQGWLEADIASELGQLWPLILVGIGLGLILRWTPFSWFGGMLVAATFGIIFGAAAVTIRDDDFANVQGIIPAIASGACVDANGDAGDATATGEGIGSTVAFDLEASLACGELTVTRSADATWSVETAYGSDDAPRIEETEGATGDSGLRVIQPGTGDIAFIGRQTRSRWDIDLPAEAALTVRSTLDAAKGRFDLGSGPVGLVGLTLNAAEALIDLADSETPETALVDLTLNASDAEVLLPAGAVDAAATLNASSLAVCVPQDVPIEVELSETLSSSNLADAGLDDLGDSRWSTPGFNKLGDHVSLAVTSTVSSFSIERPEACS